MFETMTIEELEQYQLKNNDKKQIVVQINSVMHPTAFIMPYKGNNIIDKLELQFNDVTDGGSHGEYFPMQESDALKIKKFIEKHLEDADILIVASDKQKARANGIVKALSDFYEQTVDEFEENPEFNYNPYCYNLMLKTLNMPGN